MTIICGRILPVKAGFARPGSRPGESRKPGAWQAVFTGGFYGLPRAAQGTGAADRAGNFKRRRRALPGEQLRQGFHPGHLPQGGHYHRGLLPPLPLQGGAAGQGILLAGRLYGEPYGGTRGGPAAGAALPSPVRVRRVLPGAGIRAGLPVLPAPAHHPLLRLHGPHPLHTAGHAGVHPGD